MEHKQSIKKYIELRGGKDELSEDEKVALVGMVTEASAAKLLLTKYAWSVYDHTGKAKRKWTDAESEVDALRAASRATKGKMIGVVRRTRERPEAERHMLHLRSTVHYEAARNGSWTTDPKLAIKDAM